MFRSKPNKTVSAIGLWCLVCLSLLVGCGESTIAEVMEQPADLPVVSVVNEAITPVGTANPTTTDDNAGTADRDLARFSIEPKLGDLDAMVDRRVIRVLTVYGPGRYFLENGPKGVVQEYADKLQKVVNEAFKTGLLTVQVAVIPVARDQLFPALTAGYGDIVIAGTTITEDRQAQIDFTIPVSKPLKEILVTGPSAPPISSLADLAGKTVYLRLSSSYAESVKLLSDALVAEGKSGIRIEAID
ncbi:transporter substrate-binding domain-containing protein, partial [Luminiphilus sp.]|nr:transporter substrate-binding domain-containing protein [Luminiphilus sp.]